MYVLRPRALLWPAGALLGVVAERVAFDFADPLRWIPDLLVGWAFIGCGLTAAARRPESRIGALMAATGFTWFLGNFATVGAPVVAWMSAHALYVHRGPLVHLLLSYPRGRLASRLALLAAGVGYAAALVTPVWDSEAATILLSGFIVSTAAREYVVAVGQNRRARLLALWAAAGLGLVLTGGAAARLALPTGAVSYPSLLAYETMLCVIAGSLFVGLVTTAWERADIIDLMVELGASRSGTLSAELARALGDPSLEVRYWDASASLFVDVDGRELSVPKESSQRSVTYVEQEGAPVAVIVHDPAVLQDPGLVGAVTSAARLAAANARLQAELRSRVVEVEGSRRRILEAQDEERRLLERRLHDGAARRLTELSRILRRTQGSASGMQTRERITRADHQLLRTLEDLHQLTQGLHPRILAEQGIRAALRSLAALCPVPVDVTVDAGRMPRLVEATVFFTCAEALANVAKYASATRAAVRVTGAEGLARVVVEDDGVGGAEPERGSGLRGLLDRIEALGGVLTVASAPGRGTTLAAEIPFGGEGRGSADVVR